MAIDITHDETSITFTAEIYQMFMQYFNDSVAYVYILKESDTLWSFGSIDYLLDQYSLQFFFKKENYI